MACIKELVPRSVANISNRIFACNSVSFSTSSRANKKISVLKKTIPVDRNSSPEILESKEASSVIKRLNWEFSHLYGPLRNPKTGECDTAKPSSYKRNVNYLIEYPTYESNTVVKPAENVLCSLLDFPLLNKTLSCSKKAVFLGKANLIKDGLEEKCGSYFPSVSRILEKTMPEDSARRLRIWKEKMIAELGEEGFKKYHQELLSKGSSLHSIINLYLTSTSQDELEIQECNEGHWKSLKPVFPQIKNVRLLEEKISHPFLCYQGIVDCFAQYRDQLVIIDWKTSKKSKNNLANTFDNPIQIAAYVGALNFDPRFQYLVNKGLIVVVYENGSPATELFMDETKMQLYWKEWLKRIKLYWDMKEKEKHDR